MNALKAALLIVMLIAASLEVQAAESRRSKSAQVNPQASGEQKIQTLKQADALTLEALDTSAQPAATTRILSGNLYTGFSVYSANTHLIDDLDADGFYHYFSNTFDVDVDAGSADVYAVMSVRLNGGPWNYFHTTDVFTVTGASVDDAVEVVSLLEDGYPAGYYTFRIDIYDANNHDFLASANADQFIGLGDQPLEDEIDDGVFNTVEVTLGFSAEVTGGGSLGGPGLVMMAVIWGIRRRFISRSAGSSDRVSS